MYPRILAKPLKTLEKLINAYLNLDPQSQAQLQPLIGKQCLIEITNITTIFYLCFEKNGICIHTESLEQEPDLIVRGSMSALWRLFQSTPNTFQLHLRDVKIVGDLHLAQSIKLFFQSIDIDWEEQLSRLTGDVIAHEFFRGVSAFGQWQRKARENFKLNLTEYLQEEVGYFPLNEEIKTFIQEVDILRDDIERLEIRIERL